MTWRPKRFCAYCGAPLDPGGEGAGACRPCGATFYENPVPAVAALVRDAAGSILLVERDKEPQAGRWALPGGFIEITESTPDALRRELFEETGLEAERLELLAVEDEPSRRYGRVVVVCYRVCGYRGEPRAGDDARSLAFFPLHQLPDLAFVSHRRFIERSMDLRRD